MVPSDWKFTFILVQAIRSATTAAGFFILVYETNLINKQKIDSNVRPWLGHNHVEAYSSKISEGTCSWNFHCWKKREEIRTIKMILTISCVSSL
jgi:hypothetical protein